MIEVGILLLASLVWGHGVSFGYAEAEAQQQEQHKYMENVDE